MIVVKDGVKYTLTNTAQIEAFLASGWRAAPEVEQPAPVPETPPAPPVKPRRARQMNE